MSLPLIRGPRIEGVPTTGPYELIPIDPYGRVDGLDDVYAVGDATDYPLKQGGIASSQADTAAAHVAAGYGATVTVAPFQPQVRATLLTGGEPIELGEEATPGKLPGRYVRRRLSEEDRETQDDRRDREPDDAPSGAL